MLVVVLLLLLLVVRSRTEFYIVCELLVREVPAAALLGKLQPLHKTEFRMRSAGAE